jgi:hypothetical protein
MQAKAKVVMPDDDPEPKNLTPSDLRKNDVDNDVAEEDKDDISSLAQDFIDDKPQASETVDLEEDETGENLGGPNYEALYGKDSDGIVFDPEIHATNAEGKPSLTPKGRYRKKKGKGQSSSTIRGAGLSSLNQEAAREEEIVRCAKQMTGLFFSIMQLPIVFGEEGAPIIDEENFINEPALVFNAHKNYFDLKGPVDVPPWLELSLAYTTVAGKRFTMPKTKTKMQKLREWFKRRKPVYRAWQGVKKLWPFKSKKKEEKKNGAHDDRRDDNER